MKFQVKIFVQSSLVGLDLDEQYDRLNWPEEHREASFGSRFITVEVPKAFAKRHRELFRPHDAYDPGTLAKLVVLLEATAPDDWSDWGSTGMALNHERLDEAWIEHHLNQKEHPANRRERNESPG